MNPFDQPRRASERRPRLCLLTETYYPVVGGGESQARAMAADLGARGLGVIVITRRSSRALPPVEHFEGSTIYRVRPAGRGGSKRWAMLLTALPALLAHAGKYDVIYVSGFKALGVSAVLASKLLRKPCILKADSNGEMSGAFFAGGLRKLRMTPASPAFRLLLAARNRILLHADAFVALSETIAQELVHAGVPAARIVKLPNGVDTRRFAPVGLATKAKLRGRLGLPPEGRIVTFTGRLVAYKGLSTLLLAWRRIAAERRGATLLLVGAGGLDINNCEAELREYVVAQGLEGSVRFTGDVRNVHEYLQASDCFAFPTEKEAFGLSLVEAMACGLPAVTTLTGGIAEFVTPGQNALAIAPGDADGLYEALRRLMDEPELAVALGQAALATARSRYDQELVIGGYVELVTGLAHGGAGGMSV